MNVLWLYVHTQYKFTLCIGVAGLKALCCNYVKSTVIGLLTVLRHFISPVLQEVHERAIQAMAEFTANSIEHFHRAGQLILQDKTIPVTLYPSMANSLSRYYVLLFK